MPTLKFFTSRINVPVLEDNVFATIENLRFRAEFINNCYLLKSNYIVSEL